ncbi:MAG: HAMP domain-containing histidine kinase [Bacteroidetes bacterium]|nr:HAMP domain-containing histidine kinase [Bacteroidota bacterium]
MRLLQKTMWVSLVSTIVLLMLSGLWLYNYLKSEITEEMQEQLEYESSEIYDYLGKGNVVRAPMVAVERLGDEAGPVSVFRDTVLYDAVQRKREDYYYLLSVRKTPAGNFRVMVITDYIGWHHYSHAIFIHVLITVVILALLNAFGAYFFNRRIWGPFFYNLASMRSWSVGSGVPIQLKESDIQEFGELKKALQDVVDRSQKEYLLLQQFTENAAHEIQTPLAIIQSKLDKISQMPIPEELSETVEQARSGVHRLKRLNKSLLLLAKLDNNAYSERSEVWLDQLLGQQLDALEELFVGRQIEPEVRLVPMRLSAAPFLVEILITNLLSNALRYTAPGGRVFIGIEGRVLRVANPGAPMDVPGDELFRRFRKGSANTETVGLGLAIVYQICQVNGWKVSYGYEEGMHVFRVEFGE